MIALEARPRSPASRLGPLAGDVASGSWYQRAAAAPMGAASPGGRLAAASDASSRLSAEPETAGRRARARTLSLRLKVAGWLQFWQCPGEQSAPS